MASPFSAPVLAAGAALTSPTLYGAFVLGTVPVQDALLRLVVVVAITTVAVTLVQWLFDGTSAMTDVQVEAARRLAELGPQGPTAHGSRVSGPPDSTAD